MRTRGSVESQEETTPKTGDEKPPIQPLETRFFIPDLQAAPESTPLLEQDQTSAALFHLATAELLAAVELVAPRESSSVEPVPSNQLLAGLALAGFATAFREMRRSHERRCPHCRETSAW